MNFINILFTNCFFLIFLITTFSCNKKHAAQLDTEQEPLRNDKSKRNVSKKSSGGIFLAKLVPINTSLTKNLNGAITIVKDQLHFIADVRLSFGPISSLHLQSLRMGTRCPGNDDDINRDGYIDEIEGLNAYGKILIPFDDDLSSQRMGGGIYPVSDEFGHYIWSRHTDIEKILSDLQEPDLNPEDDIIKLVNKNLDIDGKVVLIQGVHQSEKIPDTLDHGPRLKKHVSLPIACGILKKITNTPGVELDDDQGVAIPDNWEADHDSRPDDGAIFPDVDMNRETGNYGEEFFN